MKVTLDLPEDVGLALRRESARRGGHRAVSCNELVMEAIRQVYMDQPIETTCRLDVREGRSVVYAPGTNRTVSSDDVRNALNEL